MFFITLKLGVGTAEAKVLSEQERRQIDYRCQFYSTLLSSSLTVGQNKLDRLLLASFFISFVEPEACGAGFGLASKY
jgi:hypothetical protein